MIQDELKQLLNGVEGWIHDAEALYLYNKVCLLPEDGQILEIGAYKGRSTCIMGLACKGTSRKIHTIDIWEKDANCGNFRNGAPILASSSYEDWLANILQMELADYVIPHKGKSQDMLKTLNIKFDMAFIDGSHDYNVLAGDFKQVLSMMKTGSRVFMHDTHNNSGVPDPGRFWDEVASKVLGHHEFCVITSSGVVQ